MFEYAADTSTAAPDGATTFTFVTSIAGAKDPSCAAIQPGTTGKFIVDTAAMQVTHIERTVPNPVAKDHAILGTAAVDYAPVALHGEYFWLPSTITAFTTETSHTDGFRFTAHYSGYHRYTSTSTILPTAR